MLTNSRPLFILLAEDNSGDVFLVRQALAHHQIAHKLVTMSDGDQAATYLRSVEASEQPRPDLILLDLNLPKTNGHELLSLIRSEPRCSATPVIVITSSDSPKDRQKSAELGANHYFKKPFDYDDFLKLGSVIKEILAGT